MGGAASKVWLPSSRWGAPHPLSPPTRYRPDSCCIRLLQAAAPLCDAAATAAANTLPPELLRHVFSFLLPPSAQPAPLLAVARAWAPLHLTCRAWAAVLADMPVAVEACVPVPRCLPWLHRHATALRLVPPPPSLSAPAARPGEALEWVQQRCGPLTLEPAGWDVDLEAPAPLLLAACKHGRLQQQPNCAPTMLALPYCRTTGGSAHCLRGVCAARRHLRRPLRRAGL